MLHIRTATTLAVGAVLLRAIFPAIPGLRRGKQCCGSDWSVVVEGNTRGVMGADVRQHGFVDGYEGPTPRMES